MSDDPTRPGRAGVTLSGARLWSGAIAAAVVAALIALLGLLVARGLLHIAVLAPNGDGTWGDASTIIYAGAAAAAALIATALVQLLFRFTPQPMTFFAWIWALLTVISAIGPFLPSADLAEQVATAAINVLIGIAIYELVAGTARRSLLWPTPVKQPYE
jgi:hypothetical protein